jgi:hypothetical protein
MGVIHKSFAGMINKAWYPEGAKQVGSPAVVLFNILFCFKNGETGGFSNRKS